MTLCPGFSEYIINKALLSSVYVLDLDGVIVLRFTQAMDLLSARKEIAKLMVERGFRVEDVRRYIDPYDLIKLCYGDFGIHKDFSIFSEVLEFYELKALPRAVIDLNAGDFLNTLIKLGKKVYISTLQSRKVVDYILTKLGVNAGKITVCARDSGGRPKPYADQLVGVGGEAVVIGDSCTDGYLASNLKAYFIGVETDGFTHYELCSVGAIAVFSSIKEIRDIVLKIHNNLRTGN